MALLSTVIAVAAGAPLTLADDLTRTGPKIVGLPPLVMDACSLAADPALPAASTEPIIDRLKAIVLVPRPEMVARHGNVARTPAAPRTGGASAPAPVAEGPGTEAGGVTGVQLRGITPPSPEVFAKEIGDAYLGKPISLQSIHQLSRDIIVYYRRHDHPAVEVVVPEQEITKGVLQFVVIEGRLGKVRVEGNRWFSGERLARQVRLRPGDSIEASRVLADVTWLNSNPFRDVDVAYVPGKEFGTTDVVLKVRDRFPLRVYAGYENSGPVITGVDRWLTGFNWGNVFGLDHQLSYQLTTSSDWEGLRSNSVIYTAPLPWRHTLSVFGSYTDAMAEKAVEGDPSRPRGRSFQVSFRYTAPLRPIGKLTQDVFVGADFKRSNNDLEYGGTRLFGTDVDIAQLVSGYEAKERDPWGSTSLKGTLFYSPGGVTADNTDAAFEQARAFSRAEYLYGRLFMERINDLPAGCSLRLKAGAQWADGNLQASEQIGLGGYDTVRGYPEFADRGDSGYLLSAELRSPSLSLIHLSGPEKDAPGLGRFNDQLQVLAFFDFGSGRLHDPFPGERRSFELAGVGPGVRYVITPCLSVRFDYGWQLTDTHLPYSHGGAAHLGVILSY